jgi:hypothetical protein
MWLIIGSTAAYHWFSDARQPSDIDLLTPAKISGNHSQHCVVDAQWHEAAEAIIAVNTNPVFADPNVLLTLKLSHSYWDVHWDKTIFDIWFLQRKGAQVLDGLHEILIPVWTRVHGQKKVNMTKTMDQFFNDAVPREHDHERLHELVALHGRPLHERVRPDHNTAWVSKDMFFALPKELQLHTALEEIMATAIERAKLNKHAKNSDILAAVKRAHFLLCTSMTKGWFARFLVENSFELRNTLRPVYLTTIRKALEAL